METAERRYAPGICNIGPAEIARRRQAGWIGLAATAVLWVLFYYLHVPAGWRLILFLPAWISAVGFIQVSMGFCAGFGLMGVFNLGPTAGRTESVTDAAARAKDRKKSLQIIGYAAAIAAVIAALAYLFAF